MNQDSAVPESHDTLRPGDLAAPGYDISTDASASEPFEFPQPLGAFILVKPLGGGGFAEVFRGVHSATGKEYAIKVLRPQYETDPHTVQRFLREAKIAGRLKHPNVVRMVATGVSRGRHFHVMPLIDGTNLLGVLEKQPCEPMRAVEWMIQIASAITYIHKREVLHRDLKPSNVLIDNRNQVPFIHDFGLARSLHSSPTLTRPMDVLGTEPYMSPEQADPKLGDFSPATDIYGMGAVLYQMLTGRPPFPHPKRRHHDIRHQVAWDAPQPPVEINPDLHPDLQKICLKCLEKLPHDRYATAEELRLDLEAFRAGKAVIIRPISPIGRVQRFHRRRPLLTRSIAALVFGLIATSAGTIYYAHVAKKSTHETGSLKTELKTEAAKTELERHQKHAAQSQAAIAEQKTAQALADEEAAKLKAQEALKRKRVQQYLSEIREAPRLWDDGEVDKLTQLLDRYATDDAADVRGPEWDYWRMLARRSHQVIDAGRNSFRSLALSPKGSFIGATTDTHLFVWRRSDGQLILNTAIGNGHRSTVLLAGRQRMDQSLAFSPDGQLVAATCGFNKDNGSRIGALRVWKLETADEQFSVQKDQRIGGCAVAFSPDGQFVLAGGYQSHFCSWNLDTHDESIPDLPGNAGIYRDQILPYNHGRTDGTGDQIVNVLQFGGKPQRLVCSSPAARLTLWGWPRVAADQQFFSRRGPVGGSIAWTADRPHLLRLQNDTIERVTLGRTLGVSQLGERKLTGKLSLNDFYVCENTVATWGIDKIVRLWTVTNEEEPELDGPREYRGATDRLRCVNFQERYVAALDERGVIRIWSQSPDMSRPMPIPLAPADDPSPTLQTSPRGTYNSESLTGPSRFVVRRASGEELATIPGSYGEAIAVRYSPDERYVAVSFSSDQPLVSLWSLSPAVRSIADFHPGQNLSNRGFGFSADGSLFAIATFRSDVQVVRTIDGSELGRIDGIPHTSAVAISPSRRYVAIGGSRRCGVWDLEASRWAFEADENAEQFAFDPFERYVIATGNPAGGHPFAGDLESGEQLSAIFGNTAFSFVECSEDGRRLYALRGRTMYLFSTEDAYGGGLLEVPTDGSSLGFLSVEGAFRAHIERESKDRGQGF